MLNASDLLPLQKNLALKRLFANRGLDLDAAADEAPDGAAHPPAQRR